MKPASKASRSGKYQLNQLPLFAIHSLATAAASLNLSAEHALIEVNILLIYETLLTFSFVPSKRC